MTSRSWAAGSPARSPGVPALFAPRRHVVDRLLASAAAAAGAHFEFGMPVTGLLRDDHGRVRGVRATGSGGRELRIGAMLTVGAGGVGSRIAREARAEVLHEGSAASAALYGYVPSETLARDSGTAAYEWCYGRAAAAGVIPTGDGQSCVFVSTTRARMRALRASGRDATFRTLLDEAAPTVAARLEGVATPPEMRGWGGLRGYVRRAWGEGWA
uniref:FAD-dependent monooxygenase n=1 Tax=Microbacterium sp. CPCC 204701 TaxID=2493084 RepID=UPI00197B3ED8